MYLSQKHQITKQMNIRDVGTNTACFAESVGNDIPLLIKEHNKNILQFLDMQKHAAFDCFQGLTIPS